MDILLLFSILYDKLSDFNIIKFEIKCRTNLYYCAFLHYIINHNRGWNSSTYV